MKPWRQFRRSIKKQRRQRESSPQDAAQATKAEVMGKPLTQADLKGMQCGHPGCTNKDCALVLHSRCHPDDGTWATYHNGVVTIECVVCHKTVVQLLVAEGTSPLN